MCPWEEEELVVRVVGVYIKCSWYSRLLTAPVYVCTCHIFFFPIWFSHSTTLPSISFLHLFFFFLPFAPYIIYLPAHIFFPFSELIRGKIHT
jgi:hypothetical protein